MKKLLLALTVFVGVTAIPCEGKDTRTISIKNTTKKVVTVESTCKKKTLSKTILPQKKAGITVELFYYRELYCYRGAGHSTSKIKLNNKTYQLNNAGIGSKFFDIYINKKGKLDIQRHKESPIVVKSAPEKNRTLTITNTTDKKAKLFLLKKTITISPGKTETMSVTGGPLYSSGNDSYYSPAINKRSVDNLKNIYKGSSDYIIYKDKNFKLQIKRK
jgi:hypothetical protein